MNYQRANFFVVLLLVITFAVMPDIVFSKTFSWNMYGFSASHTFATDEQISTPLFTNWVYESGGGVVATSTPAADYGRFYVPQASGALSCFDETTGERIWRTKLSLAPLVSKPLSVGSLIYTTSYDGTLYSVYAKNGSIFKARDLGFTTTTSPVASNGFVYTVTDNGILSKWVKNGLYIINQNNTGIQTKAHTDPIIGNGKIIVATSDNRIICYNTTHGKKLQKLWTKKIKISSGSNALCSTKKGILTVSQDGILHHISWANGQDIWTLPLGEEVLSGILTDSGNAYLATISGNIHSISIEGGHSDWMHPLKEEVISSNLSISGGKLYIGTKTPARHLHCLTLSKGLVWNKWFDMPFGCNISTGSDGILIIPSSGPGECLSLSSKKRKWRCDLGGLSQSPAVVGNNQVYFTLTDGSVRSIAINNGEELWRKNFGSQINSSPAISGDKIIVAPSNKPVYCLDSDDGSEIWPSDNLFEYISSSPTIYGNTVFIGAWDGLIYAYDLRTGNVKRKYKTFGYLTSSPTITRDGVFIGSHDRFFYKFHRINGNNQGIYPTGTVKKTTSATNGNGLVISEDTVTSLRTNRSFVSLNWKAKLDSMIVSELALSDSDFFVLTTNGNLSSRSLKDGSKINWSKKLNLDGSYKSIILCKDKLCVLTGKSIHILSSFDGSELWSHSFGINISSVVLSSGKLIVTTQTGSIYCLSSKPNQNTSKPIKLPSVRATMSPLNKTELINEAIKQNTTPNQIMVW
jgi:eukaryotic-like serine/threonine-protein kinase